MPRNILLAFGAGILSALVYALTFTGSPVALLFAPFTMLPLFLVGLGAGPAMVGVAGVSATVLIGIIAGSYISGLMYVLWEALPAIIVSRQALAQRQGPNAAPTWAPAGRIIGLATAYAAGLLMIFVIWFAFREGGLRGFVEARLTAMLSPAIQGGSSPEAEAQLAVFVNELSYMLPGALMAWWLVFTIVNLGIAQALLTKWKRNLRPVLRLQRLEVPRWIGVVLVAAILIGAAASGQIAFVGWNLAVVCIVPFFYVGLVVLHMLARGWSPGPFFLAGFYLLLLFRGWPALVLAVLGFADQWAKLRHKLEGAQAT